MKKNSRSSTRIKGSSSTNSSSSDTGGGDNNSRSSSHFSKEVILSVKELVSLLPLAYKHYFLSLFSMSIDKLQIQDNFCLHSCTSVLTVSLECVADLLLKGSFNLLR